MELFEEIRREYRFGVGTIQGVAKKLNTHRRMVRQALASAMPPERKAPARSSPKLEQVREFIDGILQSDREAPRKQRHTAHRIWQRIQQEHTAVHVAEATVRRYVRRRKQELGVAARETFVPQNYDWGVGGGPGGLVRGNGGVRGGPRDRVFFHDAQHGGRRGVQHRLFSRHAAAFLEAHERGFQYFGGEFQRLRYDNLKSAVKKILRGYQREETDRLIAFRSHWGFQTEFCNPARGNEKGGVEGEVGYFRRNHLVPVPKVKDLAALNEYLRGCCQQEEQRRIHGKSLSVGEAMRIEREHLLPLLSEGFELAETSFPVVDGQGCVKVRTNRYSVPLRAGRRRRHGCCLLTWKCGTSNAAWRCTNAVSRGIRRCWIWSIIWTCWKENPARWRARHPCSSGENAGGGRRVSTACGRACGSGTGSKQARAR